MRERDNQKSGGAVDLTQIPSLKDLEKMEKDLHRELIDVEQHIYQTEQKYIKNTANGNIFKGWDANASAQRTNNANISNSGRGTRAAKNPNNDKLFFSLSSLSAPKTEKDYDSKFY